MKAILHILRALFDIFYGPESHSARRYAIQQEIEQRLKENGR